MVLFFSKPEEENIMEYLNIEEIIMELMDKKLELVFNCIYTFMNNNNIYFHE